MVILTVYRVGRDVFVPLLAKTEAGFYLESEPVRVLADPSAAELAGALEAVAAMGNPRVPTPARDHFPAPVMLKHAKVRSVAALERIAELWTVTVGGDRISVVPNRRVPGGGFAEAVEETVSMPRDDGAFEHVAARLLGMRG